jgi:UDP-GlcNAc:undecaprenyl-phosphate GlcNAc-1-phosphate transferase
VSVSALRISQGKSPLVGDQQHFSHRLRRRGLTVRQTLAVVYACTAITGIAGVLLTQLRSPVAWLVGVQVALVLLVLGVWELGSTRANGANAEAGPGRSAP